MEHFKYFDRNPRLIEDKVQFKNLGLAVVDEQHRFGVAQRAKQRKNIILRMYWS